MADFVRQLADDLGATDDGWQFMPEARGWMHPSGLCVWHLYTAHVLAVEPDGTRHTITSRRARPEAAALDVAKQLIEIVWRLTGRPT